jgi:hypothetical protein
MRPRNTAGPEAFPSVLRVNQGLAIRTPLKWELELLEGCLRTIPEFLCGHTDSAQITASTADGTLTLELARTPSLSIRTWPRNAMRQGA